MSSKELNTLLREYEDYTSLFAKQVSNRDMWMEQTGCEVEEEYFGYITCCENRIYDFGTWFEHTQGLPYPESADWAPFRAHKYSLLAYHP